MIAFSERQRRLGALAALLLFGLLLLVAACKSNVKRELPPADPYANLLLIAEQKRFGYMDSTGRIVIKPQFTQAAYFAEGRARIVVDGKWGFVGNDGRVVIPPVYEEAHDFCGGFASVKTPDKWIIVDRNGAQTEPVETDEHPPLQPLLSFKDDGGRWGFRDSLGTMVIKPLYERIGLFSEGYCRVLFGGSWGYIDSTGRTLNTPPFEAAGDFHEGMAAVRKNTSWGYIDKTGRLRIQPRFLTAEPFSGGAGRVTLAEGWTYVNRGGRLLLPPIK